MTKQKTSELKGPPPLLDNSVSLFHLVLTGQKHTFLSTRRNRMCSYLEDVPASCFLPTGKKSEDKLHAENWIAWLNHRFSCKCKAFGGLNLISKWLGGWRGLILVALMMVDVMSIILVLHSQQNDWFLIFNTQSIMKGHVRLQRSYQITSKSFIHCSRHIR